MSQEVQKFTGYELLVQSMAKSGWGEDDYCKAAVKAYFAAQPNFHLEKIENEEDLIFAFKEEWEILTDHEKWQATLSKAKKKGRVEVLFARSKTRRLKLRFWKKVACVRQA